MEDNNHTFKTIEAKPVTLAPDYAYFNRSLFYRFFSRVLVLLVKVFVLGFYGRLLNGFRVKGMKHYKAARKQGLIVVANHIHPMDAFYIGSKFFPDRFYVTMLKTNLGLPFFGKLMRYLGGIPIPDSKEGIRTFSTQLAQSLARHEKILVYPEAALRPYNDHIRAFQKGAFKFAYQGNANILPMVFTFHRPKGLYRLYKRKPIIQLNILPLYYLPQDLPKVDALAKINEDIYQIMSDAFHQTSEFTRQKEGS